ncbi:MAG: transposase [Simkaniaceae bacterium]|nr:MAG: transposase [Simkaniaceae bacterium]QVL55969.1 MAG: transposase [Simkaniaceae bacterium]QVL56151.1 MAG: transposase [Simkaniaceae bacterium]QVL56191.1 MAG: transposase [Simkaniaceae bacterium]QVL56479.1 MAG: transposase [Simkaniaceae bacterium]
MRGRKALPIPRLHEYNFPRLARTEAKPRERIRFLAMAHVQDGKSFNEVAQMLKVSPRTISAWVSKFRVEGVDGLREKPGRGAKPFLSPDRYEEFREEVESLSKKRCGGRIRGKDIGHLLEEKFGISPNKSCLYALLKKAGLVWITARSRHPKADEQVQLAFKKILKKKSKKQFRIK